MGQELALPSREKYWEELTDSEKIEKLGYRLEYLHSVVNRVGEAVQKLESHVHVNDRIFYGNGPVNTYSWPNPNPLGRKEPDGLLRGPF